MPEDKVFTPETLPEDFTPSTGKSVSYDPLPADIYQVEIANISIKENPFYKSGEPAFRKYQASVEMVVIDEGEFYGRRLWKNMSPSVKPPYKGKRGTFLYSFVCAAREAASLTWDECDTFASSGKELYENLKTLEKKQIRVSVELVAREDGTNKNNISGFMVVKKQLPIFDETKIVREDEPTIDDILENTTDFDEIMGSK